MLTRIFGLLVVIGACFLGLSARAGEMKDTAHPFLLWTKADITELRRLAKSDPDMQKQIARTQEMDATAKKGGNASMFNLFKYAVLEDKAAGLAEKKALLGFINFKMPVNTAGDPNTGNARWREDHTLTALRYDILYDELTPEERKGIEDSAKTLVDFCVTTPGPWDKDFRTGWLPNMQWPTMIGAHVMAVATKQRPLIDAIAQCKGGWQWYLDNYIADGHLYMEEYAKYYSNIGGMILWCNGVERLGLNELGWGYTGKGGATMRRFLSCLPDAALPQIARPGVPGAFDVPVIWMGDAGREYVARDQMPNWNSARMNGAIPKMRQPLWWEASNQKFSEDNLAYFLTYMPNPGTGPYLPTPYFMQRPMDPGKIKPPAAKSSVNFERGYALLRAEEGPGYWTSPKPAVALQFGMYYVHYVHDCYSLLDFVAHNRLLYDKIGRTGTNYAGGDDWRDHGRGQASAVVVDDLQAKPVDSGEAGCKNQRIRQALAGPAKFAAGRAAGVFPDVDLERAVLLCPEYLVDATWLNSPKPRVYDWHVQSSGFLPSGDLKAWTPLAELAKPAAGRTLETQARFLTDVRAQNVGAADWTATILLQPAGADPATADTIGVKVHMLGQDGTYLVTGAPPVPPDTTGKAVPQQTALGTKVLATRSGASTCFTAIHEPLKGGTAGARITSVKNWSQSLDVVAVAIQGQPGSGINDRVLIRLADAVGKAESISGEGETLGALNSAWVRIHADQVEAWGDLTELRVKTQTDKFMLNGVVVPATRAGGLLTWKK
jgi:hypothetical protein